MLKNKERLTKKCYSDVSIIQITVAVHVRVLSILLGEDERARKISLEEARGPRRVISRALVIGTRLTVETNIRDYS